MDPTLLRNRLAYEGLAGAVVGNLATGFASMFAARMGASDFQIGLVSSLPPLFGLLVLLPGALATDRMHDKRRMVELGVLGFALAALGVGLAPFFGAARVWGMVLLFAVANAPASLYATSWQAWFSDIVSTGARNDVYSHRTKLTFLIGAVTLLATGLVLAYVPRTDLDRVRLYQAFYGCAFLVSFLQLRLVRGIRVLPAPATAQSKRRSLAAPIAALAANRAFLGFAALSLLLYVGMQLSWPLFFVAQVRYLGADEAWLSWIAVSTSLLNLASTGFWSRFIDRHGVRATLVLGILGLGTNPFIYALATYLPDGTALPVLFAMNAIVGLTFPAFQLAQLQCLLEVVGEQDKTFRIAVFSSLTMLSNVLSPMLGVWIYSTLGSDRTALTLVMLLSSLLRLVAAGAFAIRWYRLRGTPDVGRKDPGAPGGDRSASMERLVTDREEGPAD